MTDEQWELYRRTMSQFLYFAREQNQELRGIRIAIWTVAIALAMIFAASMAHAQEIVLRTSAPGAMAVNDGTLYVADTQQGGIVTYNLTTHAQGFIGGLNLPLGLAVAADGNLYVSEVNRNRISRINDDGTLTIVVQMQSGTAPRGLSPFRQGLLIGGFGGQSMVWLSSPLGTSVIDFAGNGQWGFNGDGLPALSTKLENPGAVAVAPNVGIGIGDNPMTPIGDIVYAAEIQGARIREFLPDANRTTTTFAGTGIAGGWGAAAAMATKVQINQPLAVDVAGNSVYIAENINCRVDRVNGLNPSDILDPTFATGCSPAGLTHDGLYEYVSFTDGTVKRWLRPDATPVVASPTPSRSASPAPTRSASPTQSAAPSMSPSPTAGPLVLMCPLGSSAVCRCVP